MRSTTSPASALVLAALLAMLMATLALAMLSQGRSARAGAGEAIRLERARFAAHALLAQAIVRLDNGEEFAARGVMFRKPDGSRVSRQDAAGLVDLDAASTETLRRALIGLGLSDEDADSLADKISDWRDGDDLRRLHGAERQDYLDARRTPPRDGPFVSESELALVLGVDEALARCLAPYFTVYSASDSVDPSAAPPPLRAAGPAFLRAVSGAPIGRVVIVSADAPFSARAYLRLRAWVRLTGQAARPVLIHRAEETLVAADEASASSCVRSDRHA